MRAERAATSTTSFVERSIPQPPSRHLVYRPAPAVAGLPLATAIIYGRACRVTRAHAGSHRVRTRSGTEPDSPIGNGARQEEIGEQHGAGIPRGPGRPLCGRETLPWVYAACSTARVTWASRSRPTSYPRG